MKKILVISLLSFCIPILKAQTVNGNPAVVSPNGTVVPMPQGTAGQVPTCNGTGGVYYTNGGTVLDISSGTGITCNPNPIVSTGTISIANTAVTAGTYTNTTITVNAQGQITSASSGSGGGVTSVGSGYGLTGGTITSSGTLKVDTTQGNVNGSRIATQYSVFKQMNNATFYGANVIAGDGNSIMAGFPFYNNSWFTFLMQYYPKYFSGVNLGVPGNETANILARVPNLYNYPNVKYAVLCDVWINDVINSVPLATTLDNMRAECDTLFTHNITPIVGNCPPNNGMSSAQVTDINAINSYLAAGHLLHATIIDIYDTLKSGLTADSIKQSFGYLGGPHWTTPGAEAVAYKFNRGFAFTYIDNTAGAFTVGNGCEDFEGRVDTDANVIFGSINTSRVKGTIGVAMTAGLGSGNGGNASFGDGQALLTNTSGTYNLCAGASGFRNNTTGSYNTAIGYQPLNYNTTGSYNTALGGSASFTNSFGNNNTAIGFSALFSGIDASNVTAIGYQAGEADTKGGDNFFGGHNAGAANTTGDSIVDIGTGAGAVGTTAFGTTNIGYEAGYTNNQNYEVAIGYKDAFLWTGANNVTICPLGAYSSSAGGNNTGVGYAVFQSQTTGHDNTASGQSAMTSNASGIKDNATGSFAAYLSQSGMGYVADGYYAGEANVAGSAWVAIGDSALRGNLGSYNVGVGEKAGASNTSGTGITCIGNAADVGSATLTNATAIGNGAVVSTSNTAVIGNSSLIGLSLGAGAYCDPIQVSSATSGTVVSNGAETLELTGASATVVLTDPASPLSGQNWKITTTQASTTISFTNTGHFYAASGLPTTVHNTGGHEFEYDGTKWLTLY